MGKIRDFYSGLTKEEMEFRKAKLERQGYEVFVSNQEVRDGF